MSSHLDLKSLPLNFRTVIKMQFIASFFLIYRFIWGGGRRFKSKYICYARKMEIQHISRVMRKSTFCICVKQASYHFLCFCSLIEPPLISKSVISSCNQSSVAVQIGLYQNRS